MIKKLKKLKFEQIVYILMMIVVIGIPAMKFLSYLLFLPGIIDDSYIVNQVYVLWAVMPLLVITYIYGIKKGKYKINYSDILIYILIIFAFISTIWAVKPETALWGEYKRNEGLLSLLSYYFIFLNVKNLKKKEYLNNFIKVFTIIGIVQVIYSIIQVYTQIPIVKRYSLPYLAMGLCGNPNFLGSYMVMLSLIFFVLYLINNKRLYFILCIVFFIGLCLAGSTGPFLGFILAILFFIIFFKRRLKLKHIGLFLLVIITTFFIIDGTVNYVQEDIFGNEVNRAYNVKDELTDTFNTLFKHYTKKEETEKEKLDYVELGNGRIEIWKKLLPLIPSYLPIGAGLDNVKYIYPQSYGIIYDKAHNVYLQMILTNGIYATIAYLLLCLAIFIKGFKVKSPLMASFYIAFIGYSVQAFANISVIDVAPYFFIVLGFLYGSKDIDINFKFIDKLEKKLIK